MGHANGGDRDDGHPPTAFLDLVDGLRMGLLAFVGAYSLVVVLVLYELRLLSVPGEVIAHPRFLIEDSFWLFNSGHIGATLRPLVLLDPASLERVPGVIVYLVPPAILTFAGNALSRDTGARLARRASFVRGTSVVAGYLTGTLVIHLYLYVRQPFVLVPAVRPFVVMGLVYPIGFGGLGGLLAWRTTVDQTDEASSLDRTPETRTASEDATADEWGRREAAGRRDATASTASSGRHVHFEETLSPRLPERQLAFGVVFVLLLSAVPIVLILLYAPPSADVGVGPLAGPLVVGVVGLLGIGGLVYAHRSRLRVDVRITDSGVVIQQNWSPPWSSSGVVVPFDDISRVQYSEASGSHIQVSTQDYRDNRRSMREADGFITFNTREHRPQTYMVTSRPYRGVNTNYRGGIRIERVDSPPVYVGSERPAELARIIADRAPGVERAEQF